MGRPGLSKHRKFKRLARVLDGVLSGFGPILARGALEQLWEPAYENGDDYLGDSRDVEAAAGWNGPDGLLTEGLAGAGGDNHAGFIEEGGSEWWPDGKPGTYRVHDLYDHAPEYVRKHMDREAARMARGETLSLVRARAAHARWDKHRGVQPSTSGEQAATTCKTGEDACSASGTPPAPAPAPAPAREQKQQPRVRRDGDEAFEAAASPLPEPPSVALTRPASAPVVDEVPRPQLVVVDEGGGFVPGPDPWPRATSFRHAITLRMARTVLYPIGGVEPKIMGSLQDSLGVIAEAEAVEVCAGRVVEAVQLRRRQPGSLAYFAQVLADEAVRRRALGVTSLEPSAPAPLPAAGCPEWERLRAALRERVRPETFAKFHAPLVGRMEAGALVLVAPDRYVAAFLADEHRAVFEEWARELGVAAAVRFEAADLAAAGGAA